MRRSAVLRISALILVLCSASICVASASQPEAPRVFTEASLHGEWFVFVTSTGPFAVSNAGDSVLRNPNTDDVVLYVTEEGDDFKLSDPASDTTAQAKRYQISNNLAVYRSDDQQNESGVIISVLGVGPTTLGSNGGTWYWYLAETEKALFTPNGQVMIKGQDKPAQYMLKNNTLYDIRDNAGYTSHPITVLGDDAFLVSVEAIKGLLNVHAFYVRVPALQLNGW